jgi:hypothetical protein
MNRYLVSVFTYLSRKKHNSPSSSSLSSKHANIAVGIRHADLYPQKFALSSPTIGGRSVGIVRSQTQATEFVCICSVFVILRIKARNMR